MSSNFQGPTWLRDDATYNEYLRLGEMGELNFPEYEKDDEGRIVVHYGEAFCRWPECDRRMKKQETRNLRTHVKSHIGESVPKPVAHAQTGKVRTQAKDQIRSWFKAIVHTSKQSSIPDISDGPASQARGRAAVLFVIKADT